MRHNGNQANYEATPHGPDHKAEDSGKRELVFADSELHTFSKKQKRTSNIYTHMSFSWCCFLRFRALSWRIGLRLGKHRWRLLLCSPANHTDVCLSALPQWGRVILYLHLHNAVILELKNNRNEDFSNFKKLDQYLLTAYCINDVCPIVKNRWRCNLKDETVLFS